MLRMMLIAGFALSLAACAAVTTRVENQKTRANDGLMYWMPQRDVLVDVVFAAGKPGVTFRRSDAYADSSRAYVARFRRNPIGKNELTIGVDERGLLQSSKSKTTSDLTEIVKALAGAKGATRGPAMLVRPKADCPADGKVTVRVKARANSGSATFLGTQCTVTVQVKPITSIASYSGSTRVDDAKSSGHSGFFYRQEFPYEVVAEFGGWQASDLVVLPNDAPVRFLPVERSLFASNESNLTFVDGSPTQYQQTVDGEAISVFKLPAAVIEAYFGAVGAMFDKRKAAGKSEQEYLAMTLQLMEQQRAVDKCRAALASKDDQRIADDCK